MGDRQTLARLLFSRARHDYFILYPIDASIYCNSCAAAAQCFFLCQPFVADEINVITFRASVSGEWRRRRQSQEAIANQRRDVLHIHQGKRCSLLFRSQLNQMNGHCREMNGLYQSVAPLCLAINVAMLRKRGRRR